jgi:hypothetical protein
MLRCGIARAGAAGGVLHVVRFEVEVDIAVRATKSHYSHLPTYLPTYPYP